VCCSGHESERASESARAGEKARLRERERDRERQQHTRVDSHVLRTGLSVWVCRLPHTFWTRTFHTRSGQHRYLFQRPSCPRLPRGLAFASSFVFPIFVVAFRGEAARTRESGVEFCVCVCRGTSLVLIVPSPQVCVRVRMTRRRRRRRWWWQSECGSANAPHLLSALSRSFSIPPRSRSFSMPPLGSLSLLLQTRSL